MNLGVFALKKRTINHVLTFLFAVGGLVAYQNLGRLEDPEFTIKQALVMTPYPGASAAEVDKEVTHVIDQAVQELEHIKRLESRSARGLSIVQVFIKDKYKEDELPQIWDMLRKKVTEAQSKLPPGCGQSSVNDDFGDVYGIYAAITGEGFTYRELKSTVDLLRRELQLVKDVKRVVLWGAQQQAIYIEMQRDKMAQLGITQAQIFDKLGERNLAGDGGRVETGGFWLPLNPSGSFTSEQQFLELLISEPGSDQLIYLGDVATVTRGYRDPPSNVLRMSYKTFQQDGELLDRHDLATIDWEQDKLDETITTGIPAIGLAISTAKGGNVVAMGAAVTKRVNELQSIIPYGLETHVIAVQSEAVTIAVNNFIKSLIEAIAIVVVVLLIFMGLKSGLLIGFILFVTVVGTFLVMDYYGIMLERISLGALIIALGMLVDNAIVVTEGMMLRLEAGEDKFSAAKAVVGQNAIPLLGATIIAVLAFGPIGLSEHDTGEYCRSLFLVLLISLLFSWFTAMTTTPLYASMLFKAKQAKPGQAEKDPYAGGFYKFYRRALEGAMRYRYIVIPVVYALFGLAIYGFGYLPPGFFPASSRPQYFVDIWMSEGSHIRQTEAMAARLEKVAMERDNALSCATHVGAGGARFLLVYNSEQQNTAYAQLLITVKDPKVIDEDILAIEQWAQANAPEAIIYGRKFKLGPGVGGNIQLRVSGPDRNKIREISQEMRQLMLSDPHLKYCRSDWQQPLVVVQPKLALAQARRNGISRPQINEQLQSSYAGHQVGVFREGESDEEDRLIPIIARSPIEERGTMDSINDLMIHSPAANRMIPMRQVVEDFETVLDDGNIRRRNRVLTLTLHGDQTQGESAEVWQRLAPRVEDWFQQAYGQGLSSEYYYEWGPEYEDAADASAALAGGIPGFVVLMVFVTIVLFNNLRQPLIIWLVVPLALVGVVLGLTLFKQPFNFMAILGTLSLSGMLIKNAIVLMDEINSNIAKELPPYEAVVQAGVSRMRPVSMAAATTVLGMLPLLKDVFFVAMSIAVMFGLTFATILTLVVVPTLYVTFYRIPSPEKKKVPASKKK